MPDISPRLLKGGIVLIDPDTAAVQRIIALQYNPDTLTRTLQVQAVRGEGGRPLGGAAAQGPAGRDDQARRRDRRHRPARVARRRTRRPSQLGIHPQLAALETIVYPTSSAAAGQQPAGPARARSRSRRWRRRSRCSCGARTASCRCGITDFSITEEAFDPTLNPIRAKVSLGLRVLQRRRPRLRPQGRQPVHGLSAAEGAAGRAGRGRRASPRSASEACRERSDPALLQALPDHAVPADQPLLRHRRRRRSSPRTARRSSTCGAASCRRRSASPLLQRARRDRRATGWTTSPRSTSATPSSSGGSATPTARCGPTS